MPVIGVIEILIQVYFAVHAGRSGRYSWIFIILFFPIIGSLIYFFVEYLPELQMDMNAKKARKPKNKQSIKELKSQLEITDSAKNRLNLAEAYFQLGQFEKSTELLEKSLNGIYSEDLDIIKGLCFSCFHAKNYNKSSKYINMYTELNNGSLPSNIQSLRNEIETKYSPAN
jgi:hypothetical protein